MYSKYTAQGQCGENYPGLGHTLSDICVILLIKTSLIYSSSFCDDLQGWVKKLEERGEH